MSSIAAIVQLAIMLLIGVQANPNATVEQKEQAIRFSNQALEVVGKYLASNGDALMANADKEASVSAAVIAAPAQAIQEIAPTPSPEASPAPSFSLSWGDEVCGINGDDNITPIGSRSFSVSGDYKKGVLMISGKSDDGKGALSGGVGWDTGYGSHKGDMKVSNARKGTYQYSLILRDKADKVLYETSGDVAFSCK